ncbi:MAG TPA: polysaccharide biosynthesis/export family protein [Pirellulales bacterium]|nr:polysaccharide biosynthesis/export family protein [Pirellulales bacterium]
MILRAAVMDDMGGFTRAGAQQNRLSVWCRRLALAAALGSAAWLVTRSPTVQGRAIANQRASSAVTRQADVPRGTLTTSRATEPPSADPPEEPARYTLCQALGPAAPYPVAGLDCAGGVCGEMGWRDAGPIPWQRYAQGEYLGHARTAHVPEYRLRVGDVLDFIFRLTREPTAHAYRLKIGDRLRIELLADPEMTGEVEIQPDGMIALRLLGQVPAARLTVPQLRETVEERYRAFYRQPSVTFTPLKVNSRLEDLRASVDQRFGAGGQTRRATVTPEGTVQLPVVHSVSVQGLTLAEAQREIEARYTESIDGIEIIPVLVTRAPRYVYVLGEVANPGRYELVAPTTVMQAIALAGGWNYGGNLCNTVVFRRADDWRLMATQLDLRGVLYGHRPCPADEIWINDSDVVLIPKSRVLVAENVIALVFVQGLFRFTPFHTGFYPTTLRYLGTLPTLGIVSSGPGLSPISTPAAPAAPTGPVTAPVAPSPTPPIPLPQ